jgi:hypothetical protein
MTKFNTKRLEDKEENCVSRIKKFPKQSSRIFDKFVGLNFDFSCLKKIVDLSHFLFGNPFRINFEKSPHIRFVHSMLDEQRIQFFDLHVIDC